MLPQLTIPKIHPEFVLQTLSEVYDWGLIDLNIPKIHQQTQGEGIKIAILDSGKSQHFETVNRIVSTKNFSPSETDIDKIGHSTFISGLIAAEKNNEGIIGIAPKSELYIGKAIDDGGRGEPAWLVNSVLWAIDQKVDIISISAGMFFDFKPLHEAIKKAYNKNILVVAACGNSGTRYYDVAYPARYPEVIGVAAYDHKREIAPFSSRGINVRCAMPGVDIYSCWLDNQFAKDNGTSFACPVLVGVCALILSKYHKEGKNLTPKQVVDLLKQYAVNIGNDPKASGFGTINTQDMFGMN